MSKATKQRDTDPAATPRKRMASYRQRKRDAGFRQVQIWIPDLRKPEVLADYKRQAEAIANGDAANDDSWLDQAYEWPDYEPDEK